ncbi:hypothetical protein [Salinigranum salinum]|nr:hypothetical protein [Salinigranum salinum]
MAAVDVETSLLATASLVDLTLVGMFAFVVGMVLSGLEEQS